MPATLNASELCIRLTQISTLSVVIALCPLIILSFLCFFFLFLSIHAHIHTHSQKGPGLDNKHFQFLVLRPLNAAWEFRWMSLNEAVAEVWNEITAWRESWMSSRPGVPALKLAQVYKAEPKEQRGNCSLKVICCKTATRFPPLTLWRSFVQKMRTWPAIKAKISACKFSP